MLLSRRTTTLGLTALLAKPAFAEPADAIAAIERAQKGRVGVFAIDTGSGRTLAYRADERFPMQSTFKGPLAACVLARVDAGQDGLDRPVAYGTKDMVAVSPVTLPHLPAGSMTVGALCQAILERSDNTAANLLLARVGGPAALTAYLRTLGDAVTQVHHYEPVPSHTGPADTTTPRAVAGLARATVLGAALSPASRALLVRWMGGNVPGRARLRAVLPPDWAACDRTGTGDDVCNDYAVVWPPGRKPVVMAVYLQAPGDDLEPAMRAVGRVLVSWAG